MKTNFGPIESGWYEPYNPLDIATACELWLNDVRENVAQMSTYDEEIKARGEVINIPPCSTLADEPWWMDDPDHEDRRKDYLENYAADDELPF